MKKNYPAFAGSSSCPGCILVAGAKGDQESADVGARRPALPQVLVAGDQEEQEGSYADAEGPGVRGHPVDQGASGLLHLGGRVRRERGSDLGPGAEEVTAIETGQGDCQFGRRGRLRRGGGGDGSCFLRRWDGHEA